MLLDFELINNKGITATAILNLEHIESINKKPNGHTAIFINGKANGCYNTSESVTSIYKRIQENSFRLAN